MVLCSSLTLPQPPARMPRNCAVRLRLRLHARAVGLTFASHPGSQVCIADGAPLGWRGCVFGANPRTLLCASAATVWLADARSPPPSTPRVVHLMAGGRPTAESFTALCSAEPAGSFMFGAATGTRILLFDSRRAHAPLLAWEHSLGGDDPPRILSCQSAQPWMPAGSADAGCFLLASNLGRREAAAFQFRSAQTQGTVDAIGWASELLRTRIGVHAINAGMRLPSLAARSAGVNDASDTGCGCCVACAHRMTALTHLPGTETRSGICLTHPRRVLRCLRPMRVAKAAGASCAPMAQMGWLRCCARTSLMIQRSCSTPMRLPRMAPRWS